MKQKKIGIIGCGIFGAEIALQAANQNHQVEVFESKSECLLGATMNNQNRLHLGFHYPRDINTANQCIKGFKRFIESFDECVDSSFANTYFIASEKSKTSPKQYIKFCNQVGLSYENIDQNDFPIEVKNVDLGITTKEVVYDCKILRKIILSRIKNSKVNVTNNTFVDNIKYINDKVLIFSNDNCLGEFDAVINCTYSDINHLTQKLGHSISEKQYEYTFVPIINVDIPRIGVTIMDGGFMTLLPYGKTDKYLLYHVDHSVISRCTSKLMDQSWNDEKKNPINSLDIETHFKDMIDDCSKFLPILKKASLIDYLHGPRMVLAKSDKKDERPSNINFYSNSYCTIFSGKIDHCKWVADEILDWVNLSSNL